MSNKKMSDKKMFDKNQSVKQQFKKKPVTEKTVLKKTIPEMVKFFEKNDTHDTEEVWEKKAIEFSLKKKNKKITWRQTCIDYIGKLCVECCSCPGRLNKFHEIKLCNECSNSEDYALICKTSAKKDYFLKDEDFEDAKYIEEKNPHYRSAKPMRLYSESEIKQIFYEKYNVDEDDYNEKQIELERSRKTRSDRVRVTKQDKVIHRRGELIQALNMHGLELRADSKLCDKYIDGTLDRGTSLNDVVRRMCQMKYLHEYCDMNHAISQAKKLQREERKEYGRDYCPIPLVDEAEPIALEKNGGRYPDVWPWLE